jgi:hypothetical protein
MIAAGWGGLGTVQQPQVLYSISACRMLSSDSSYIHMVQELLLACGELTERLQHQESKTLVFKIWMILRFQLSYESRMAPPRRQSRLTKTASPLKEFFEKFNNSLLSTTKFQQPHLGTHRAV